MSAPQYVVIGVTGPLGGAVARRLRARGDRVRGVNRSGRGEVAEGVELVAGDVRDLATACRVCAGASVVFQCASAPYTDWTDAAGPRPLRDTDESDFLPAITEGTIAGAADAGAHIVYGDNHYMYGPVVGPVTEDMPWNATDRKGQVRTQVARRLLDAHAAGTAAAAIGCASDFFGPGVINSTVGERVFGAALRGEAAEILAAPDALHTYSYIEDVAAGLVTLADQPGAFGHVWNLPNDHPVTPVRFFEILYEEAGHPPAIRLADPARRRELGYQDHMMDREFIVDHSKFAAAFDAHPTPLREAVATTLAWFRGQADIKLQGRTTR